MSYTSLLINTCTAQRNTAGAQDAYGTPADTWADHLTDIACRLKTGVGGEGGGMEVTVGAEVVIADYKLFLGDVDITEQDRVIIDSITYEVLLVTDKQDGTGSHHKECFMRVVRGR